MTINENTITKDGRKISIYGNGIPASGNDIRVAARSVRGAGE